MLASAIESSLDGHQSFARCDLSQGLYTPPYDISAYIRDFSSYLDTLRFSVLPQSSLEVSMLLRPGIFDTADGACYKG